MSAISHWNIKLYDEDGHERETLRGLTYARKETLMQIFEREGVHAQSSAYTDDRKYIQGEGRVVNSDSGVLCDAE